MERARLPSPPLFDRNSNKSKIDGDFFPVGRLIRVSVRFLENVAIVERALSINQQSRTYASMPGIDVSLNARIMEIPARDRTTKSAFPFLRSPSVYS